MMTNGIDRKLIGKDSIMAFSKDYIPMACSDYFDSEIHSPTDSSEDSVEVKICPISVRNKRKLIEPRKVHESSPFTGPLKKRMCLKVKAETEVHPFRPWSPKLPQTPPSTSETSVVPKPQYFRPPSPVKLEPEEQPVALIKKKDPQDTTRDSISPDNHHHLRVPIHPQVSMTPLETERLILNSTEGFPVLSQGSGGSSSSSRREQRNYKNMTRERRIEANARERTRVHTISAAFETLRHSVPSYSHNQKLSKLSVLRIACSYIMTLSSIVNEDDEEPATIDCVESVTRTIQREGKLRKKKDDND